MRLNLTLNGKRLEREIAADQTLLGLLRTEGCYSLKRGCDTQNCGLCTVWVDEKPVLSCTYLAARAQGKTVTTLEGVQEEAAVFSSILTSLGAEQCGFCAPGLIMAVLAMKKELTAPSEGDMRSYLSGNLCRCTGYGAQMEAIRRYMEVEK